MRRLVAASVLVVLAIAVIAWFVLDPGPLHRIVVTWVDPQPASARPFWQIAIEEDGTYTYSTNSFRRHGKIPFAPYAERFRSIGEVFWTLPPRAGAQPGMSFWAVGTRRTVAPFAYGNGSDHPALRAFGAALHDAVVADQPMVDAPRFAALNGLDQLRSIEMRARGAGCVRCLWTIRVDASGHAHAHRLQPMHLSWSTSTMPSSRLYDAPVGHSVTHAASAQCMHDIGKLIVLLARYSPTS